MTLLLTPVKPRARRLRRAGSAAKSAGTRPHRKVAGAMTYCSAKLLPYAITGLSTLIGRVLTIDEWADAAQIPERSGMGVMSGALVERVLGISGKSWDPDLFADLNRIISVARDALLSANLEPHEIDTMIVVTLLTL